MIKIVEKDAAELIPYENNARINDDAVKFVANSIKEFGFKNPIIIDANNVIIAGHTRLKAAQSLGIEKVPCIIADDLTEDQIKAFRIADNSTAAVAEWDMEKLLKELENIDTDMSQYGLMETVKALERELEKEAEEDEYVIPEEIAPRVHRGEIWQLGRHRLMCGDSTKEEDVVKLMDGNLADMVMTDPPYNVAIVGGNHTLSPEERKRQGGKVIENDKMDSMQFREFLINAFFCMGSNLKKGGAFYIWFASREHINFETALNQCGFQVKQELIWVKNSLVMGMQDYQWKHEPCLYGWKEGAAHYFVDDRTQCTVLEDKGLDFKKMKKEELVALLNKVYSDKTSTTIIHENRPSRNELHPTMKPVSLFGRLIKNSSKQNEKVLDLFGGSGTTIIACEQLNRDAYVMEFDEKYATVIVDRWEKLTKKKAVKIC